MGGFFQNAYEMKQIPSIAIAGRRIAADTSPYVIAELSANHNARLETAQNIIQEAKRAGADAIKLQTYTANTITLNCDAEEFQIHGGLWAGMTLYKLYKDASMPWDWHKPLFEQASVLGITIFSSPFDRTAVDLLEDLNASAYKIASFEAIDLPLIEYVAGTKKPIIVSTGMASAEEIQEAIDAARGGGCKELALLHCVSGYPAPAEDYNLHTISDMIERFGLVSGLSDHTKENTTAIASVALEASIIEKHFTLNKHGGGPDDIFSLEPDDLMALCRDAQLTWKSLGEISYELKSSEKEKIQFRRSLYFVKNLQPGDVIGDDAVRSVRPGFGLAPKYLTDVLGKRVNKFIHANTPVTKDGTE